MATGQQSEFINMVASLVIKYAPSYNIKVVSPIIAQAIIESNWGKSGLTQKANNLFGIKCGSKWTGKSVNMKTQEEYTAGTLTDIKANFRAYDSLEASVHDYFEFTNTKRYEALRSCTTPRQYCEAIKAAGYATSSTYVNTLMHCIDAYNLTSFDDLKSAEPIDITPVPNPIPETPVQQITSVIDYTKVVTEVINGIYGNGDERITRLAKNGYNPMAVQYMVNLQLKINELTNSLNDCYTKINKAKEALK
jgi:hypothetical protein